MSSRPILCPQCKTAIVAAARKTANPRLRVMPDLAYGEPSDKPDHVRVICPSCHEKVDIPGRLFIEPTAA